jgi:protein Tex
LDPGLRTGVKVAVVDSTGKLLSHTTIFPHAPQKQWDQSLAVLLELCQEHNVDLISIGNGTASRETEQLIQELLEQNKDLNCSKIVVSEAGASVYSASEYASKEFQDLDVSFRGAVSIARRLQDPLAELVKIEPKSIGVGLYQHDVSNQLSGMLDNVVEDCVNAVGVDLNTASLPLLSRVAGLNKSIASNIIAFRDEHGEFKNRLQLQQVPRLGEKAYQQAAGFLRVQNGDNILDSSGVHPEAYSVVEKIASKLGKPLQELVRNSALLKTVHAEEYIDDKFGLPTIMDIISELEKPGRDPRPEFKTSAFKEGINSITDLAEDMLLEGVVTNVSSFGAFIDIGVHQDGLAHISELANRFVSDPRDVVKTGDIVMVRVLGVDKARNRINLSLRLKKEKLQPITVSSKVVEKTKPTKDAKAYTKTSHNKVASKLKHEKPKDPSLFGNALLAALKSKD